MRSDGVTVVLRCFKVHGLLAVLALLCSLPASPALAAHMEFGTEGEGAGQLSASAGIAVNQESGDVYIADEVNNRVDEFHGDGAFVRAWGWGVDDGLSEEFQLCVAPGPCFAGVGGTGGGQFAQPRGVAVDGSAGLSHGDVYVEDPFHHRFERFSENGELILTVGGEVNATSKTDVCLADEACQGGTPGPGPSQFEALGRNAIAVGPTGTVYVGDVERVQKFSAAGAAEGEIELSGVGEVELLAVDSSGELYVLGSALEGIRKYDGAGVEVGVRDRGLGGFEPAIALDAGDELLVSDPFNGHILGYDAAGAQLGSFAEAQEDAVGGLALNQSTRALYVLHARPARVVVQALPPPGPFVREGSEATSEVLSTTARLEAAVDPEGVSATTYRFEYGTSEAYGTQTSQEALGPGFEDQPASAVIAMLRPSTIYHYRVVATNVLGETTFGPDETFETLPAVSIDSESTAEVTASSAKLLAELNPHGLPSEYHFEYGLTNAYEASAPVPDGFVGDGVEAAGFAVPIEGLRADTVYHYRVVAHNSLGVVLGLDQTFTTRGGEPPELPDGRAYEMVSPASKRGVSLEGLPAVGGVIEAAKEGGALAYFALGPIDEDPAGNRSNNTSQLLARREGAGSWSTQDLATPHQAPAGIEVGNPSEYKLFSSDLSRGVVEPKGATPLSSASSERTPYVREPDGAYTPLVSGCPPPGESCKGSIEEAADVPPGTEFGGIEAQPEAFVHGVRFVTATPDLRHVLLRSSASLVQEFETGGEDGDFEWNEGKLVVVSILPGEASAGEEGASTIGNTDNQVRGAISADGERVFFATAAKSRLYARDVGRDETLRVDVPQAGLRVADGGATFQLANSDGSSVLFTDGSKLTKDATAVLGKPDLYECEIVIEEGKLACELSDLSVDPHPGEAADVQGTVLGASEDGRYVYFVAKGALAAGAAQGSCPTASEGQCENLYVDDTVTRSKALVAVLSADDFPDWRAGETGAHDLNEVTTRVSPDGRYVAFMSERSLTGYDNRDLRSGALDEEVFLYHAPEGLVAEAGTLSCASCDPTGERPTGALDESTPGPLVDRPSVWEGHWLAGSIPGWTLVNLTHALRQPRYLANSGRLFFDSSDALVAADGNATQDVYEHEPDGVGSCDKLTGCVSLISSGTSSEETAFLDASENGDDVFFLTAARLSAGDRDNAFDVYDAHVCVSAPGCAAQPSGAAPLCEPAGDCRAEPTPQPDVFGAPASSTVSGSGNLTAPAEKAKAKAKPLTRAQRLARALRACKRRRSPKRRTRCVKRARARYGSRHSGKGAKPTARRAMRRAAS
jgi:hypothetical protein